MRSDVLVEFAVKNVLRSFSLSRPLLLPIPATIATDMDTGVMATVTVMATDTAMDMTATAAMV